MPMDRSLYPDNWEAIALRIKEAANWQCQECGKICRKPGEDLVAFIDRYFNGIWRYNDWGAIADHPQKWTLTVAHLNHEPSDCSDSNLKALCAPCHLRYDVSQMATKRRLRRERLGQMVLPLET